jgi:hypothetical protein
VPCGQGRLRSASRNVTLASGNASVSSPTPPSYACILWTRDTSCRRVHQSMGSLRATYLSCRAGSAERGSPPALRPSISTRCTCPSGQGSPRSASGRVSRSPLIIITRPSRLFPSSLGHGLHIPLLAVSEITVLILGLRVSSLSNTPRSQRSRQGSIRPCRRLSGDLMFNGAARGDRCSSTPLRSMRDTS